MVDLPAISASITAIKAVKDISQALIGLRDSRMIQEKVLELQGVILEAQGQALSAKEEQAALIDKVRDLERELSRMKEWDREKDQYQLVSIGPGGVAYAAKSPVNPNEPKHYLCANCYQDRQKSFLQRLQLVYHCARCDAKIGAR